MRQTALVLAPLRRRIRMTFQNFNQLQTLSRKSCIQGNQGPRNAVLSEKTINRFKIDDLLAMAADLEDQARRIRLRAARLATQLEAEKAAADQAERLHQAARLAADDGGGPSAVARAAKRLGVDRIAVAMLIDRAAASRRAADRAKRNMMILRLAERGWQNAAIAARFQLSPTQVSRIVQAALRHAPNEYNFSVRASIDSKRSK